VAFPDEERADLIAALSRTAEMVGMLLDALDVTLFCSDPNEAEDGGWHAHFFSRDRAVATGRT
jgi:hypothetical protein